VEQKLQAAGFKLVKREDGNGAEVGGVTQATMQAFSSRRAAITPAIQRLADEYTATHGRPPSRRALWSLRQWATLETRKSKHEVQRTLSPFARARGRDHQYPHLFISSHHHPAHPPPRR
jgi:hypothetical protein